jgi:hypothetical protein
MLPKIYPHGGTKEVLSMSEMLAKESIDMRGKRIATFILYGDNEAKESNYAYGGN